MARGLTALELVAVAARGVVVYEVADQFGVHRTIASRLLTTLAEFQMISRGPDGRYRRGGAGVRGRAGPARDAVLRRLSARIGATIDAAKSIADMMA